MAHIEPKVVFTVLSIFIFSPSSLSLPQTIKIGGLFDIWDPYEETGFRHAAERVNADPNAFPLYGLSAQLEKVQTGDSYNASRKVCELLREGVGGVIGPQTPMTASHVQSVCEVFNIPRIETKWDFRSSEGEFLINLFPHPTTLSMAYADAIQEWGWSKIIIIYENDESLVRLQGIFELTGNIIQNIVVKQLPTHDDFRLLMKDLKTNYGNIFHIIIDCHSSKLPKIFQDAKSENVVTHDYTYFLTSLDIHILNVEDEAFANVNITSFRLVDPSNSKLQVIIDSWKFRSAFSNRRTNHFGQDPFYASRFPTNQGEFSGIPNLNTNLFMTETALIYDAMELFALALHRPEINQQIRPESLNCDAGTIYPWNQGSLFMHALKQVEFQGLSGDIHIHSDGKRRNFKLEVMEISKNNISKIGDWSPLLPRRLNWTRTVNETLRLQIGDLEGLTLRITTKPSPPYSWFYDNGTYEGYAVDLIDTLAKHFKFNYVFHKVADTKMGGKSNDSIYKHGWDGLIGEILDNKADLAVGDMSITSQRAAVIDFSLPFMNIGISILYKKPEKSAPKLFSFLDPFHYEVWIYMATAYLGVSLILFILARIEPAEWQVSSLPNSDDQVMENPFSLINVHWLAMGSLMTAGCDIMPKITPYEWLNPHPCVESPDELELTLHLTNSLWFSIGTLMQQGSDIAPKAGSTRMVAGIWWFFTLILISSYTANLAAFLTSEGMVEGIKDIKDLPKQTKVKYGTLQSGSTRDFFRDAKFPLYQEIHKNMESMSPSPHVKGTTEGGEKVKRENGRFAFFMESASIEYAMERDCSLVQLGAPLDSKGFGIGFRKGSKFRNAFNIKLLDMAQSGYLEKLKTRWWKERGGGLCKTETTSSSGAQALTLGHVGGVFVVLLGGCIMAIIMVIFEFMWKARKLAKDDRGSIWTEIWKELKFALQCQNTTKPIRKAQSINPTIKSALFNSMGPVQEILFKHAAERINGDRATLPHSKLSVELINSLNGNSFYNSKAVCGLLHDGVAGIFGKSQNLGVVGHMQVLCNKYDVPYFETNWDFPLHQEKNMMINFFPHPDTLGNAYGDLVEAFGWEKYVILYDNVEILFQIQRLISKSQFAPNGSKKSNPILRRLPNDNKFRTILRQFSDEMKIENFFIFCNVRTTESVLTQAQEVGMITRNFKFILSSLDLHTLPFSKYQYGGANITAFRIINHADVELKNILTELNQQLSMSSTSSKCDPNQIEELRGISTEVALVYDAMKVFAKTLHALDATQRINIPSLSCNESETWEYGVTILNYIKMVPTQGLSGRIDFNNTSFRTDVSLDVINLTQNGIQKIGIWNPIRYHKKFKWFEQPQNTSIEMISQTFNQNEEFLNRPLIVSTLLNEPYIMKKKIQNLNENEEYEGYIVDLLEKLSEMLHFKYIIRPFRSNEKSEMSNTTISQWNQIVQEIVEFNADIGIGDLTITGGRQRLVDFIPFMHHGITILHTTPKSKLRNWFFFLSPFSRNVWISIGGAYIIVSLILYTIARISPDELTPVFPCKGVTSPFVKNVGFSNALWIILASLLKQNSEIQLRANSTRMVGLAWACFTLMLVSIYTANLVTHLLLPEYENKMNSVEDLMLETNIQFGCINGGSTMLYFQDSGTTFSKKIWKNIKTNVPNSLVNNVAQGIDKVLHSNRNYAFFAESPTIEFHLERTCGTTQVGGLLNSLAYGIAIRKESTLFDTFNDAILKLQDDNFLANLKEKWWKLEKEKKCPVENSEFTNPLRFQHLCGIFFVLIIGCIFAVFLTFCEFFWMGRNLCGDSVRRELGKELEFALKCRGNVKLIKKSSSSIPSVVLSEDNGTPFLDLGINSYGFPSFDCRSNGGGEISRDDLTFS